jgi:hypothetical protein
MSQGSYRFSYTPGADGKHRLAVEVYGPLPDPLAGLTPKQRQAVLQEKRTWGELSLLMQTINYPGLARQAVQHHVLACRRQRYEARGVQAPIPSGVQAVAPSPRPDREPQM